MATVAAFLAASALAAPADAAPVPVSGVNWDLSMNTVGFFGRLSDDCIAPSREELHWVDFDARSPFPHTKVFEGIVGVTGAFDPATKSGTITGTGAALRFDQELAHGPAIRVGSFGLKAAGGTVTVTARITRARGIFARSGPAQPVLRLSGVKLEAGPFLRKGKVVPDSFVIAMQGRATVLPAFARALSRIRCSGRFGPRSRPIRAGTSFGVVRAQLRPDVAAGIGGTLDFGGSHGPQLATESDVITVTPTAPARLAGKLIRLDLPAGQRTPLRCTAGYDCAPAPGAQFPLAGGFVLSQGARSTTVAALSVTYTDVAGQTVPVVTGALDGAPVTILGPGGVNQDFAARVAAALGAQYVQGDLGPITTHFAQTGAP